jgi:hypothetical protein
MAVKFWKDDGSLGSTGAKYVEECSLKGYHTRPVYGADWCKEKDMVGARHYHWGGLRVKGLGFRDMVGTRICYPGFRV